MMYIGTSKKTISLYKKYGAKKKFFCFSISYRCEKKNKNTKKIFDIIFVEDL